MKARVILSASSSEAILSRPQKMKSAEEMDHLEVGPVLCRVSKSFCTASPAEHVLLSAGQHSAVAGLCVGAVGVGVPSPQDPCLPG